MNIAIQSLCEITQFAKYLLRPSKSSRCRNLIIGGGVLKYGAKRHFNIQRHIEKTERWFYDIKQSKEIGTCSIGKAKGIFQNVTKLLWNMKNPLETKISSTSWRGTGPKSKYMFPLLLFLFFSAIGNIFIREWVYLINASVTSILSHGVRCKAISGHLTSYPNPIGRMSSTRPAVWSSITG